MSGIGRAEIARSVWVLALVALTAACGDRRAADQVSRGGQVVIAEGADINTPHPIVSETNLDSHVISMLYMSILGARWENGELLYQTSDENPMSLARSYEFFGPDSASLRYNFRTDVLWSDGRPVTAHDAAWSIETQGIPEVASPRMDYSREIREVVVENDSTLVIHFTRRYPDMFFHTAGAIAPRHVYEGSDLSQLRAHPAVTSPVGALVTNGPFLLTEWVRGQRVVLSRNPNFEPQPILDRIIFRIIPEETTRMIELQTGNVDVAQVPYHFVDQVRAESDLRIEVQDKRSYEYVAYNPLAKEFFADPEIRRALGLAIDKAGLISALQFEEFATPAGGPYSPIFRNLYDPEEQAPLPYDTAAARRIFAEKGWTPGPDGVLQKDGQRLGFQIVTNGENRRRVDVAQILEQQWRRVGVEAQIQTLEFNTVMERTTGREFEAAIGGWGVGISADLYQMWGPPDLPFNIVSYDNPEVQRLFSVALEQPTDETAAPYWKEAAALIVEDQPYTWLYYYDTPYGFNDRVQGNRTDTLSPYQEPWLWHIVE